MLWRSFRAELAEREVEKEKSRLWTKHNDLEAVRSLIFCDPENGWNEIITDGLLECSGELARQWAYLLRKEIFWGESICDDIVIQRRLNIDYVHRQSSWGPTERNIVGILFVAQLRFVSSKAICGECTYELTTG